MRILNRVYEVALSLRGRRIELRYDPFQKDPALEVYHRGHYQGSAHLADLHLNSQHDRQKTTSGIKSLTSSATHLMTVVRNHTGRHFLTDATLNRYAHQ